MDCVRLSVQDAASEDLRLPLTYVLVKLQIKRPVTYSLRTWVCTERSRFCSFLVKRIRNYLQQTFAGTRCMDMPVGVIATICIVPNTSCAS